MRFRDAPLMLTKYVLLDPEFDNFTYKLDNAPELARTLSALLWKPQDELARYLAEPDCDPAMTTELRKHLRWRLDVKHQPPLGRRYALYALARALKPALIVESGTQDGLGAIALLRALELNASEGDPGRLLSVDTLTTAGWMVPDDRRHSWMLEYGSADEVLARVLPGNQLGLMIEDTP
jgi:hypothetical protein